MSGNLSVGEKLIWKLSRMIPELKRAIIKFVPNYFSWNEELQEEYRLHMPEEDDFNIRQFLLAELFGIAVKSPDEMDDAWQAMTEAQCSEINGAMLPLQGIGGDYFYLNECFAEGRNILSFPTLYDYDFADYQFQEDCRRRDFPDYQRKPYQGSLYFTWARLLIDGKFSYGVLSMLAGYINSEVDGFGNDYIAELIPYQFKPGKNHGKKEDAGYLYDMKTDASGLEPQLDELKRRFWNHLQEGRERLQAEFSRESMQQVFILNTSREGDPNHQFIFTDKDILPRIAFKTFMVDCRKAEQSDHSILADRIEEEKGLTQRYLKEQHADIMTHFNGKIVRLTKKNKIILHKDSGLDELLD